jgi:hypothetical protein
MPLVGVARKLFPFVMGTSYSIHVGPFPKGMPIGLITNMDMLGAELPPAERDEHRRKILSLIRRTRKS